MRGEGVNLAVHSKRDYLDQILIGPKTFVSFLNNIDNLELRSLKAFLCLIHYLTRE